MPPSSPSSLRRGVAVRVFLLLVLLAPRSRAAVHLRTEARFPEVIRQRLVELLTTASGEAPQLLGADAPAHPRVAPGDLVLSLGDTPTTRAFLPREEVRSQGPEGFVLVGADLGGARVLVADGNPPDHGHDHGPEAVNRGVLFAAYAALERLGFSFLHPLAPTVPARLGLPPADLRVAERPYWPVRGIHLHTMHPIELTELLNGFGPGGPGDRDGWESQLPRWDRVLEWSLANRQNLVEWVLLEDRRWVDFSRSELRQERLGRLVDRGHEWGLQVGVDAPVALAQQNGWRLIRSEGDELRQILDGTDWLLDAGFDFLNTELGFSEFHSPSEDQMLEWLNALTARAAEKYQREVTVKIHCSNSEETKKYRDPETGKKWNRNFLPYHSDPRLGVMVHTVQHYSLDDPAPTYGREDFTELRRYLQLEGGRREVLWYPETAYWVSFDIDVPLFLPLYAGRRLHDLRLIARDEIAGRVGRGGEAGSRMQGQVFFSSGWEWGYWLNDVITARAAWNPRADIGDDAEALRASLADALVAFGSDREELANLLARTIELQHQILVQGKKTSLVGELPALEEDFDLLRGDEDSDVPLVEGPLTGQAYLQGVETWDDVADLLARVPFTPGMNTQPRRLGPLSVRGRRASRHYREEIRPLLVKLSQQLGALAREYLIRGHGVPGSGRPLWAELQDSAEITALRARQVLALYDVASRYRRDEPAWKAERLATARDALDQAMTVVERRERSYRVPADEIAGWRPGSTVYPFRYLWTVRSLFYWWRDEGKVTRVPRSPCFLNIMNPAEVATAEGVEGSLYQKVEWVARKLGWAMSWAEDCLHPPGEEPGYQFLRDAQD